MENIARNKIKKIAFITVSTISLFLISLNYMLYLENSMLIKFERIAMNDKLFNNNSNYINGLALEDKYYCVWTENRNIQDIEKTDTHERCHILINKNEAHFCG